MGMGSDDYDFNPPTRSHGRVDAYDEDGIRRPDEVRQSRLIGGRVDDMTGALSRAEDESVSWLFPPPNHLSFPGSFQEARLLGKEDKKWLLVNIQLHTDFTSQMLNRDTWTDEFIITLMRSNLVFWQRGHTSGDGQEYMRKYQLSEENLPRIAIVDPRTGAEILTILGFISPQELANAILEFLDSNSFDSTVAPRTRHINMRKLAAFDVDDAEDANAYMEDDAADDNDDVGVDAPLPEPPMKGPEPAVEVVPEPVTSKRRQWSPLPEEPPAGDPMSTRISLKLVNGKTIVRRFRKTDPVEALFALAASQLAEEEQSKVFDIMTTFPVKSLHDSLASSLEEASLCNSQVAMRWMTY